MRTQNLFLCRVVFSLLCLVGVAVQPANGQQVIRLTEDASISLITVYPGNQAYNLFGHSAVRVRDPFHGFDLMYNYGTFQFDHMFLPKFIYGKLDYMLWVEDFRRELQKYQRDNRSVVEQVFNLTAHQKQEIFDFLQHNAKRENRYYRYDFLFDNCSTRIRDVFEHVMGDSLSFAITNTEEKSFRKLLDPYIESQPFLDAGIDLALAMPTDRVATGREMMFLPIHLMEGFDEASFSSTDGTTPLVKSTERLFWKEKMAVEAKPQYALYATTWLIFILALWVTNGRSPKVPTARKWFDRFLFGFCGIAGILALFLWVIAIHVVTDYNWNLLWAWPTHLIAVPAFTRASSWLKPYMRVAAFIVFITILGWFFWPQEMHTAFIPLLLAIAIRCAWWGWKGLNAEEQPISAADANLSKI